MRIIDIVWANLRRRKVKAAFLLAGLTTGIATAVALVTVTLTLDREVEEKLDRFGANIVVAPRTEGFALSYGGLNLGGVSYQVEEISADQLAGIDRIKNRGNIQIVAPMVLGVVEVAGSSILLAGIDPAKELRLKKWWKIDGTAPAPGDLLAGSRSAGVLGLSRGQTVSLNGAHFKVSGILAETGSGDDELLFATIEDAWTVLDKRGMYSIVEVSALCRDCPVDEMVSQISAQLPGARVSAVQQVVKAKMQALDQLEKFSVGVSSAVLFVAALIVLVTMMGSVRERTREIGIFRAIGFRRRHIVAVILLEAGILSFLAGVGGWLAGVGAARLSLPLFTDGGAAVVISLPLASIALAVSLTIGLLASLEPARRAVAMAPAQALRILE